jgi:hypothetical protein
MTEAIPTEFAKRGGGGTGADEWSELQRQLRASHERELQLFVGLKRHEPGNLRRSGVDRYPWRFGMHRNFGVENQSRNDVESVVEHERNSDCEHGFLLRFVSRADSYYNLPLLKAQALAKPRRVTDCNIERVGEDGCS